MSVTIREMRAGERVLLEDFLYLAIFVPEGEAPPPRAVLHRPELRVYVKEFGEGRGDTCFVAEAGGAVIGAAWSRIMDDYGHIDDETPSLAIAVRPEWRGKGVGSGLMLALLDKLATQGWGAASLSVQAANPALRLYRRLGFKVVSERDGEYIMRIPLN